MSNRKRPRGRPSKYPPEFQRDAVAMVLAEGRAIAEVARAIGVNDGTLGNWVAKARRERSAGVELNGDERSELAELRAEVTQLRMERDLLRRNCAVACWHVDARDPSRGVAPNDVVPAGLSWLG